MSGRVAANAGTAAVLAAEVRRPTANPVHSSGEPTGTAGTPSAAGSTPIPAGVLTISDTGAGCAVGAESVRSAGTDTAGETDARVAARGTPANAALGLGGVTAGDGGRVVPLRWAADRGGVLPTTLAGVALCRGAAAWVSESALTPAEGVSGPAAGVSAQATADVLKAAAPTPRATAKPPTRPMRSLARTASPLC